MFQYTPHQWDINYDSIMNYRRFIYIMQNTMDDSVSAIIVINPVPPTTSDTREDALEAVMVADAID